MKTKFYILTLRSDGSRSRPNVSVFFLTFLIAAFFISPLFSQLYINEIVTSNSTIIADPTGEYDDWIEIYNNSNSPINLADYYFSDDPLDPTQFKIPSTDPVLTTVPANSYLLFWADNDTEQGENHTNFKLSAGGGSLHLYHTDGTTLVDEIMFPALVNDYSYGRLQDGDSAWDIFATPSPTITNAASQAQLNLPVITPPSGLYTGTQTISMSAEAGTDIYYTTDGSKPTTSDNLYTNSFTIDSTKSIKAIATKNGSINSRVQSNSYIQNSNSQLPILHVTIDPIYLWDDEVGMYVEGTNGTIGPCRDTPKNWNQDWEYQANAVLFEKDGSIAFNEGCGLSISGGCSRTFTQKSFNISFKKEYGVGTLDYKLFENKEETKWEGFKIRSGGNHNKTYRLVDAFLQKTIEDELDVDQLSSRPVAVYLNNEYWGFYYIRDRANAGYIKTHYPKVNADSLDLIKIPKTDGSVYFWLYETIGKGDNLAYYALDNYMTNNSLAEDSHYNYVASQIDINSYLDYIIANVYFNNRDWPGNNLRAWRERSPDEKWRWMMSDLDAILWGGGATNITLLGELVHGTGTHQREAVVVNFITQLMKNEKFKAEYIQRCNSYINTVWDTTRIETILNTMKSEAGTEIQADFEKWGGWNYTEWNTSLQDINNYFSDRPDYMRSMIDNELGVNGRFDLSINVTIATNGKVNLHSNAYELPFNYSGIYHKDVPIKIHAVPNAGYRFSHWLETGNTNAVLNQSFNTNTRLTPVFEFALDLIINEVHYNPDDTINRKEFVEIYNPDSQTRTLDHYQFNSGICFEFPEDITIAPNEYLIIAEDASQYEGNGYQVFEWKKSGLDKNGESLVLQNPLQQTIDSVFYKEKNPWDEAPDGQGYSLELLHPSFDQFNPLSWFRSDDINGTPGAENSRICNNSASSIVINEINYNSDNLNFDPSDWVELYNPNPNSANLSGWTFYNQDEKYVFPQGAIIPAEGYLLLVEDTTFFNSAFTNLPVNLFIGNLPFSLSNKGERISLFDNNKCLIDYVIYNDKAPWPAAPDGGGASLVLIDASLDNAIAPYWKASDELSSDFVYGSPGKSNLCAGMSNTIICSQISSSADDAEEKISDSSVSITSTDLDIVNDEGVIYTIGLRFQNIGIPHGVTITSAVLEFAADEVNTEATNLIFKGENIDNAPAFTATNNNISNRTTTSNSVTWEPDSWTTIGVNQKTVNLSPIVQEIIDRPNFAAGNAIALIVEGMGIRTAESFDGDPLLAPKLCITYSSGGCGVNAKILLEGFYDSANSNMQTKLVDKNLLPLSQPFNTAPWNYSGTESATAIPSGATDWVLIATRDSNGIIINQAAGFINQDGALINVAGQLRIPIPNAVGKTISVHHKSHLAVISSAPYDGNLYDFTTAINQAEGTEQLKLIDGKYMLYSGDYDATGIINSNDFNEWKIQGAVLNQYIPIDGDGNGIINNLDFNLWQNNKSKVGQPSIRY